MSYYQEKLERIFRVSLEISEVRDLDVLMERILTEARALVNADAGSIYIKEGDQLRFSYTQNETLRARLGPGRKLPFTTFTLPINHGSIAGYVAATGETLDIPDVYNLPAGAPYSFDTKFDRLSAYHTQSLLTLPMRDNRGEIIGVLQIINPQREDGSVTPFLQEDRPLFRHFANHAAIVIERAQMTRTTILRMIRMAELRDPYETGPHANRVASYALEIFESWAHREGMPPREVDRLKDILKIAAILHDVGKIAISDSILKKPGRLTDEEFEMMRAHTHLGAHLFSDSLSELDLAAASVALNHHERWDGAGYPGHVEIGTGRPLAGHERPDGRARGKLGHEIPLFGRIVAIADVYDALCSRRSYKEAWQEGDVVEELKRSAGSHFDPVLVDAFLDSIESIRSVARRIPY